MLRKLLRESSLYAVTSVAIRVISFAIFPILAYYLTPSDFGTATLYFVAIGFFIPVLGLQMPTVITLYFFKEEEGRVETIAFNLLLILLAGTLFWSLIAVAISLLGWSPLGFSPLWQISIPLVAGMRVLGNVAVVYLRNLGRAGSFGLLQICNTLVIAGVTLGLLIVWRLGWEARAYGVVAGGVMYAAYCVSFLMRGNRLRAKPSGREIKNILKISLPLTVNALGMSLILFSDRLLIDHYLDRSSVGIYSAGLQFGMLLMIVTHAFAYAWSPFLHKKFSSITDDDRRQIVRLSYGSFATILVGAVVVWRVSILLIPVLMPPAYHGASVYVFWSALAVSFIGMGALVSPYLLEAKRTDIMATVTILAGVLNVGVTIVMIRAHGALGAIQASALCLCLYFLALWWFASRVYPMPWNPFGAVPPLKSIANGEEPKSTASGPTGNDISEE